MPPVEDREPALFQNVYVTVAIPSEYGDYQFMKFHFEAEGNVEFHIASYEGLEPIAPPEPVEPVIPPTTYTKNEIKEQEATIINKRLDIKEAEIELTKFKNSLKDTILTSTIDGTVNLVQDMEQLDVAQPFIKIAGSQGTYVETTLSEIQLGEISIGQPVNIMAFESGIFTEGTVLEISPYPVSNNYYYGGGNPNVSYYQCVISVPSDQSFIEYEGVEISVAGNVVEGPQTLYISKAYTRTKNGETYVMVDDNGRLKKQVVYTGKEIYGEYVEILSGLRFDQYVAFPYDKNAKDGVKTIINENSMGIR